MNSKGAFSNSLTILNQIRYSPKLYCRMASSIPSTFRRIEVHQFGDESALKIYNREFPSSIAPNEVVVKVAAIGVNPVETYIRSGVYPRLPQLPYIPGSDFAGTVVKVGDNVTTWKAGDRVFSASLGAGAYSEIVVRSETELWRLPDRLSFSQGSALFVPYATAYRCLFARCNVKPGELVLIHGGSGGVGLAVLQLARLYGIRTFATASSPDGRELVIQQGAEQAFDHSAADYIEKIKLAAPGGIDVIVEMLANVNLAKDLELLGPGGRIGVVGSRGTSDGVLPRYLMSNEADVRGVQLGRSTPAELKQALSGIEAAIHNGVVSPIVDIEFPLEKADDAHRYIISKKARSAGKVVLIVQ